MKRSVGSILAAMAISTAVVPMVAALAATQKGDKPKESPGWVVVEEDIWHPFYYDADEAFRLSEFHYRRSEERAAARELQKAIAWLKFASSHALPQSKKALTDAVTDLQKLASDLDAGAVSSARRLDDAFAKANHALSVWHYFKAQNNLARKEERWAAQDLEASTRYLQNAADSAGYEFSGETVRFFDEIDEFGRVVARGESVSPNRLEASLSALDREIKKLAHTLEKTAS